jgi:hypothetical protein
LITSSFGPWQNKPLLGEPMAFNKTGIAFEIAALLVFLVVVEWLAHVLTNTRDMFVPATLILGITSSCAW